MKQNEQQQQTDLLAFSTILSGLLATGQFTTEDDGQDDIDVPLQYTLVRGRSFSDRDNPFKSRNVSTVCCVAWELFDAAKVFVASYNEE